MPRNNSLEVYKKGAIVLIPALIGGASLLLRAYLRISAHDDRVARQAEEERAFDALEEQRKQERDREELAEVDRRMRERAAERRPNAPTARKPSVLVDGQSEPEGIAVDKDSAYWINGGHGELMKAPLGGGAAVTLATKQELDTPRHAATIALDADAVYWVTSGTRDAGRADAALMRVAKAGGEPKAILSGLTRPTAIAIQGSAVYWVEGADRHGRGGGGVMKAPKAGGTIAPLAVAEQPCGLAVDDTYVYWVEQASGSRAINQSPKAGGDAKVLATVTGRPGCSLAVDAGAVYWIDRDKDALMRTDKRGDLTQLVAVMPSGLAVIAADADRIYALTETALGALTETGSIFRVGKDPGAQPEAIVVDEPGLNQLAIGVKDVVWTRWTEEDGDGAVAHAAR